MPKQNPYLIKENYKQVEEVREMEKEVPSFEKFKHTYQANQEVSDSYASEEEVEGEAVSYGPGNEESRTKAKAAAEIGIALTTIVCPPAGIGLAAGTTVAGAGIVVGAKSQGDEEAAKLGVELIGIGATSAISGTTGLDAHAKKGCPLPLTFCKK